MSIVTLSNGKTFQAEVGASILEAAERASLAIEHSCRTGRCGSCKAQVTAGQSRPLRPEVSLREDEIAGGMILTCAREATSDLSLDIEDLSGLAGISVKTLPCRIDGLSRPAPDVMIVTLRLPPGSGFKFRAGQYIDVVGHGGVSRSYSVASDSAAPEKLEIQIRQVPGGLMSDYWFGSAKPNDLLRLRGPLGTFFLRNVAGLDLVFLATGTGIAPVKSMLAELATYGPERAPRSVALFWGGRLEADLYWSPGRALPGLNHTPVLSRAGGEWVGERGHVQDALMRTAPDIERAVVYACGSDAMIQSARVVLQTAGLPKGRFFSDAFVSSS